MAIDEKIKTSEIDNLNDSDELQLSPAHQVLMSCIWMSLKVRFTFLSYTLLKLSSHDVNCCAAHYYNSIILLREKD